MRVRGGSAFGMAAAHAFRLVALDQTIASRDALFNELERVAALLLAEKPTMATIHNAIELIVIDSKATPSAGDLAQARAMVASRADRFLDHSRDAVGQLGHVGVELVAPDQTIMMHSYSASVLSVFEAARRAGKRFEVICTESRPLREGRFAAARLSALGVPVTFVSDAAMAEGTAAADWALVGADSIAMDGSVANKMGTNLLSLVAERYQKHFYVASEVLKLRPAVREGQGIELERRPGAELAREEEFEDATNITVGNQFFDLTPAQRIRAIITEQGLFPPDQIGSAWDRVRSAILADG